VLLVFSGLYELVSRLSPVLPPIYFAQSTPPEII
jgi:hypothetical protein